MKLRDLHKQLEQYLKIYDDDTEVGIADFFGFHEFVIYTDIYKNKTVVCIDKHIYKDKEE